MNKYYCRPIKLYVNFLSRYNDDVFQVLLFGATNGVLLFPITMPFHTGRKLCAYINNKDYPWLYDYLLEKGIAFPTHRSFIKDGFTYSEFKFKKEI